VRGEEWLLVTPSEQDYQVSERQTHAEATYERLFGPRDKSAPDNDPELMEILRRFIFGDVFDTGVLDDQTRELITVTVLASLQTLPQLKSHTAAALNVGVQPIEIREAIYQLAPFIGFPRTLNAVATINDVFRAQGIQLPLPVQGTCWTPTGTLRVSLSRLLSTETRSRTTWPTCPSRLTRPCRGS
jgi:4-carboxymuconolactone decarboxylase